MEPLKFCLTFRDTVTNLKPYTIKFDIKQTELAQHWLSLLIINVIDANHPIEKTYCLQGWQTTWDSKYSRNVGVLCDKLNTAIAIVNRDMKPKGYPGIDLHFSVEALKTDAFRDLMNDIHHHFELLIGQVWNVSLWYKKASEETRTAIRMLNNYCHEIEKNVENINNNNFLFRMSPYHLASYVTASLNGVDSTGSYFVDASGVWKGQKDRINANEYESFQEVSKWGDVQLFYSQLGKSHLESFVDKDEHIDKSNISSYQYISGEFVVHFICTETQTVTTEFKNWLTKNDFDITDKTLGIGYPVVAEIDMQGQTKKQILKQMRARDDLFAIAIEDSTGNVIHYKEYDYTWKDEEGWKK